MRKQIWGWAALFGLTSCQPGPSSTLYPTAVQKMLDAEFPADGRIHVQSRGRFELKPETFFCVHRPGSGLDGGLVRQALASVGQSDYWNGAPRANGRFGEKASSRCDAKRTGNPIFVHGIDAPNRTGKPYRLTLAIWQGDAAWVGVVERTDGPRPDALAQNVPVNDGPGMFSATQDELRKKARMEHSKLLDYNEISGIFLSKVTKEAQ
jgi:hypothetical protein